jgi:hypothetical protein
MLATKHIGSGSGACLGRTAAFLTAGKESSPAEAASRKEVPGRKSIILQAMPVSSRPASAAPPQPPLQQQADSRRVVCGFGLAGAGVRAFQQHRLTTDRQTDCCNQDTLLASLPTVSGNR